MVRRGWRWAVVALGLAVLVALPALVAALPADDRDLSAAELRAQVVASEDVAFSGYAISTGGLVLPVSDALTGVADLLSDQTALRAWYRDADDWRVDVVTATGETGTHRDASGTWTWDYADQRASRGDDPPLALPSAPDLLPSALGRRLLSEATDAELTRIAPARVAGVDAVGLRYTPADAAASVSAVDVWVDPGTGLPLRVVVRSADTDVPALDTRFLDLDLSAPAASTTDFSPPADSDITRDQDLRDLDLGRQERADLPSALAGLARRTFDGVPDQVGAYGSGITVLAVSALPGRAAGSLRDQLSRTPGAVVDDLGVRIAAGPLSLMVAGTSTRDGGSGTYLLAGTVTLDALAAAARQIQEAGR
ncbi:sigma E regulatory protein, MucB/RseB [Klenkia marina]|uniref:Sigma E regulatory protein, MucB/RseB n=1 Tax=Klenkia marina TaxID=1960309 RepID=A0A1G4Y9G7_9ACTN|nr:transcriptional regulator [Klenkia marina]SCX50009.1 sigma E regulatory protein, MucB/RseB [Klenkia marina]